MIFGLLTGIGWFAVTLAAQVISVRLVHPQNRAKATQRLFAIGLGATVLSLLLGCVLPIPPGNLLRGGCPMASLWGLLAYGGLFVLYMPFYYTAVASLSVQTIVSLSRQLNGSLTIAEARDQFAGREIVAKRLETMVDNGFLRPTPFGFALTSKGRVVAVFFLFLKNIWRLGPGG
jgi:hypothetical protein